MGDKQDASLGLTGINHDLIAPSAISQKVVINKMLTRLDGVNHDSSQPASV